MTRAILFPKCDTYFTVSGRFMEKNNYNDTTTSMGDTKLLNYWYISNSEDLEGHVYKNGYISSQQQQKTCKWLMQLYTLTYQEPILYLGNRYLAKNGRCIVDAMT